MNVTFITSVSFVLLPDSRPAVFSLCAVNIRSSGNNSIIQIVVIKYQVS